MNIKSFDLVYAESLSRLTHTLNDMNTIEQQEILDKVEQCLPDMHPVSVDKEILIYRV